MCICSKHDGSGDLGAHSAEKLLNTCMHKGFLVLMAYSTPTDVKAILLIDETTWDAEITGCITSCDALIVSILAKYGLTVPTPTPQNIIDASAFFAAWKYRRARDPVGAKAFEEEANRFLDAYLKAAGVTTSTIPFRTGEGT